MRADTSIDMRLTTTFAIIATSVAAALVPTAAPASATAAEGCLPTNGLMNLNDADDLLAGKVRVSSSVTVQIGSGNVDWTRTSLSDQSARSLYSLKWVEELVREHRRTGQRKYLDRAVAITTDFVADNPPNGGPDPTDAWYPMFAGQRATTIACVAAVSNNAALHQALRSHASWLSGQADGLAAWNQAIDPYLGLLRGGCDLNVPAWRNQALSGFERIIKGMIDKQGALMEQAPGYGRFVWERWGTVVGELEACGLNPPAEIARRRDALLTWLGWMSRPDGTLAHIGDSKYGTEPPTEPGSLTEYTMSNGSAGTAPNSMVRVFDNGYVVGRSSWSNFEDSTYWTLRFGPGRIHHGHEDHTSVTFWVDGREVLIDSGHVGYTDRTYQTAMQSQESHNVLTLPNVEYRIRRDTELTRSSDGDGWRFDEVSDDVYARQNRQVIDAPRVRGVLMLPDDGVMVVRDRASQLESGPFDQLWHLVPGANVHTTMRNGVVARHPSGQVDIHVLQVPLPNQDVPRSSTQVIEGSTDPVLGWASGANGRTSAPVVRMRRTGTTADMVTVITTTPVGGSVTASTRFVDGGAVVALNVDGEAHTIGLSDDGSMQIGAPKPKPYLTAGARRCVAVDGAVGDVAVVNLTPVGASGAGDGQLISSDVSRAPVASNVNYGPGSVDPNVALAPIGADGKVCFQNAEHASVHVVADHLGTIPAGSYRTATSSGAPERAVDTRGGKPVAAGARRCFAVDGAVGDVAVVNLTPVGASGAGDGQLISSDVSRAPVASNVNYGPGSVDPNVALAPIGADGKVCFQNAEHASVHVVADHLGTIPAGSYRTATSSGAPERAVDTRGGKPVAAGARRCFAVDGAVGDVAVVNLTPVGASGAGDGQLISSDVSRAPVASNVNYGPGSVDPNVALAPIGADGKVCFQNAEHASVHVVADHLGTIAAPSFDPATVTGAPDRVLDTRQ